jgi:hypothetical protein
MTGKSPKQVQIPPSKVIDPGFEQIESHLKFKVCRRHGSPDWLCTNNHMKTNKTQLHIMCHYFYLCPYLSCVHEPFHFLLSCGEETDRRHLSNSINLARPVGNPSVRVIKSTSFLFILELKKNRRNPKGYKVSL